MVSQFFLYNRRTLYTRSFRVISTRYYYPRRTYDKAYRKVLRVFFLFTSLLLLLPRL